jgi:hypothetical protein
MVLNIFVDAKIKTNNCLYLNKNVIYFVVQIKKREYLCHFPLSRLTPKIYYYRG